MRIPFRLPLTAALLLASQQHALAAASILIWPIDPVIEDQQQATALWLENRDSKPVYMQTVSYTHLTLPTKRIV